MLVLAALVTGCGAPPQAAQDSAGARLEAAAEQAGLVADPARASLVGSWALDTDRVCVVPGASGAYRIGVSIDYGEGQGCAASGSARRGGDRVAVTLGACHFDARFEGDRIVFPATVPAACDRHCTGRASLAALAVEHLSASVSEAETLRSPGGKLLCAMRQ
ncbi:MULTISPECIES: hypothetical protein [unclassified Sphingomonas]|jgi:hypothetical protein|uniref:hypothetical protein n=1 Tax=unclassified Sphingomonas TaxID=196159 RepID=UPI0025F254B3|nr:MULTISPECIES: hypothetical protein [unclassified Sphingomonas]